MADALMQEVLLPNRSRGEELPNRSRGEECLTHPSYFMIFGSFKDARWPREPTRAPENFVLGRDIEADMEPTHLMPSWAYNGQGLRDAPFLGTIKTKPVDFKKVAPHSFQTNLWLGCSVPSKASQRRFLDRSREKGGKGNRGKGWQSELNRSRGSWWSDRKGWTGSWSWHGNENSAAVAGRAVLRE